MTTKYSLKKNRNVIIIWILSIIILVISFLYTAEREKYVNEKEELDKANMYLYELEVESSLRVLLNYLGLRPVESVDWEEQKFREGLTSILNNIEEGIRNIEFLDLEGIPGKTQTELRTLQEKITSILGNIQSEKPLDEKAKEEIMNFSKSIHTCKLGEYNRNWEQINTEVECLNRTIDSK